MSLKGKRNRQRGTGGNTSTCREKSFPNNGPAELASMEQDVKKAQGARTHCRRPFASQEAGKVNYAVQVKRKRVRFSY